MSKQANLDALKRQIEKDNPCSDMAKSATQLVFGEGDAGSEVVFIGEAPGKQEDLQGKPFVGSSGKLLNEMLKSINMDRSDVYITNIVKYRPEDNRDPLPEEKKEFWPYLIEQLKIIKPKLVVTLGRHSGQAFIPDLHISADHGKTRNAVYSHNGSEEKLLVLPLYHPAAALYNGSLKETLFEDFKSISRIIKKL